MKKQQPFGVPVVPNESNIRGRLRAVRTGPEGLGHIWEVEVKGSYDIGHMPNLTRSHVGKVISIYVHPQMEKSVQESDCIEARVFFQGDERGGAFFLKNDEVRKL